jgi:nicotinamidase/pyrazinamidase
MKLTINRETDALLIIDPQNDFCPGGALAVARGDEIMKPISALAEKFDMVVVTQDWHPKGHKSFATAHYLEPYTSIEMPYGEQTLWPDHCVQGTKGAEFHRDLKPALERAKMILRKGYNPEVDSYSAYYENDKVTQTGLHGYLWGKGITRVFLVGLAYDFCVAYSAIDAKARSGVASVILKDMTRAINLNGSVAAMEEQFERFGVVVADSSEIEEE